MSARATRASRNRPISFRSVVVLLQTANGAAPRVCTQLTMLRPPAAMKQVGRDPIQPRQHTAARLAGRTLLERDDERLCGEVVGEVASRSSMEISMNRREMPLEDRLERHRLTQRPG